MITRIWISGTHRLWAVWWNHSAERYEAVLGNTAGCGGTVRAIGRPGGPAGSATVDAVASGENLVVAVNRVGQGKRTSRYVTVVAPAR